jgi:hypothetical protein
MLRSLVLIALLVVPVEARPRPEPCEFGRFVTPDGGHVVSNVVAPATESIVLEVTSITIQPGCSRITFKPKRIRKARSSAPSGRTAARASQAA